jgi:hypothetical protein
MKLILNIVLLLALLLGCSQAQNKNKMKVAVWDTYVTKKDGSIMHFDILAPDNVKDADIIHNYGKKYLKTKGQEGQPLSSKECRFCHVETLRPQWEADIKKQGYFIIEMENCN